MRDKDAQMIYEKLQLRAWLLEQGFDYQQANQNIEEGMLRDAGEWLAKRFAIPLVVATSILGNLGCSDNTCPADAMQQAAAEAQSYTQSAEPDNGLTPDNQDRVDAFKDPAMRDKWTGKFKAQQDQETKNGLADEIRGLLNQMVDRLGVDAHRMVSSDFEEKLENGMSIPDLQSYKTKLANHVNR